MKTFLKLITVLFLILSATLLIAGGTTVNGPATVNPVNPAQSEINYFATVTGTGGCSSWSDSCTLRNAILRCPGSKHCRIYVGAGYHNMDNVGDATGTTVTASHVHIQGVGITGAIGLGSELMNANAGATHILRVTGEYFSIDGVTFNNTSQADKNVIMLNIRASNSDIYNVRFKQNTGDGGGTAILLDNTKVSSTIKGCFFHRIVDRGLDIGDFTRVYVYNNTFYNCGTAVYASHANAGEAFFEGNNYTDNTTALNLAAAVANHWHFTGATLANNTTNFTDVAAYGGTIFIEGILESSINRSVYPLAAAGVAVAKDADAYVWGAYVDIVPAATFNKPILLQNIIFEHWNAAQIFKIELFYDDATPGIISLGVYEITAGDPAASAHLHTSINMELYVPARATIGAKLMSSTAGADHVDIALGYELL